MAPKAPSNLGPKARRVWREITAEFELRIDELRILEDACREIDLVDRMETQLAGEDLQVQGSMGQKVANGLLQQLAQHRRLSQHLLASLKLVDDDDQGAKVTRSTSARAAANARWSRGA